MWKVAILIIVLFFYTIDGISGYGGRDCRNYPFAPRCLGVAAKRSPTQYEDKNRQSTIDIYSRLIKRVLEEDRRRTEPLVMQDKSDLFHENKILEQLASLVETNQRDKLNRKLFIASQNTWPTGYKSKEKLR